MSEILNTKAALDLADNDIDLYKELLQYYLSDNKFDVKYFTDLIVKSKQEAATYIHRIKGSSSQIGAELACETGQKIEDILKGKSDGNLPRLINDFCGIYIKTQNAVSGFLETH
ncbi:MAG: Hpt domain-containing protein [Treponema sp.]